MPSNYLNLHSYTCSTDVCTLSLETSISALLQIISGFLIFFFFFSSKNLRALFKTTKKRGDALRTFYGFLSNDSNVKIATTF